jgi:sec-independent protein translocase protein TatB
MFDLGWTEMMLIGIVALIVVGPKELPGLFRTVGHAVGKARGMARDFSRAMESAADETGLKDIDRTIRAAARPAQFGKTVARDALGLGPEAKAPGAAPAGLEAGTPLGAVSSPATEALATQRREEAARRAEGAVERAEAALRRAQDAAARARVEAQSPPETPP